MDLTSGALGAGALGAAYFAFLQLKKWIPAGWAAIKAKLGSGKIDLSSIEASLSGKVTALEQGAVAEIKKGLAAVQTDLAAAKPDLATLRTAFPQLFPPPPAPGAQQQPQG